MRPATVVVLTTLVAVVAPACGGGGPYQPSPELLAMRALAQERRQIEADAARTPPVPSPEAAGFAAGDVTEFDGAWRRVVDLRPEHDATHEWVLHLKGDRYFFQAFIQTDHGPLYWFAARGPVTADDAGRLHLVAREIRRFDPNMNMAGVWEPLADQAGPQIDYLRWPFVFRPDRERDGAMVAYHVTPDGVNMNRFAPFDPTAPDYAHMAGEDAGLAHLRQP